MADDFDVFLSHSAKDKEVVRPIAERLRADGLRVWLDDWEIRPGDNIPAKIEEGLEHSRVLLLCMSANAFGSEWAQLEAGTFRFRDPLNKERRFIPLRLDEAPINRSLAQFLYINWLPEYRDQEYAKLLEACRPQTKPAAAAAGTSRKQTEGKAIQLDYEAKIYAYAFSPDGKRAVTGSDDKTVRLWDVASRGCRRVLEGHSELVTSVAWSTDQRRGLSGSDDKTVRLWDMETGVCLRVLKGHSELVTSVAWSTDQRRALSGSDDKTVRLWDVEKGKCCRVLTGHTDVVWSLAWSEDQRLALSGGEDKTVRLWDVETGRCLLILEGHGAGVRSVAWSPDQSRALTGAADNTVRLWDTKSGHCLRVFEGHGGAVVSVAWNVDHRRAISSSYDGTVRLWDVETGRCLRLLEGHTIEVRGVTWAADGHSALSGDAKGDIRVWDLSEFVGEARSPESGALALSSPPDLIQYTNAKVILVGESGAGKTGLSKRLALNDWGPSDSTVGAWATQWRLPVSSGAGVEREIWLWDFGGQADQRLIHQLYMDDTALAVLVFDGQKEDLFETLGQWDRDLTRAARRAFTKLLVAGRVDAGGLRISRSQVGAFAKKHGYVQFLETSAKANIGCEELKQAIVDGIRWEDIPWRSTPLLFKRLKEEIIRLKDAGWVLLRFNELRETLQLRLVSEGTRFIDEELKAVVSLLSGPGVVWELKFGSWVLLQPESINAYAQAVIQTMREDEHERGCLPEERVLRGDLTYHSSMARLEDNEERFILLAMHQTLVERGLCLREYTDKGPLLIFPSYYRRERPELVGHPAVLVSYRFDGFLDEIYATLVVRLHHTEPFQQDQLWRYAADFRTLTGKQLGVKLIRRAAGTGELEVYFDPAIEIGEKIIFSKYVHEHLLQNAMNVVRLRHYVCPHCGTPAGNREVAMKKLEEGKKDMLCVSCEKRIPLWDEMEKLFASPEMKIRVNQLQEQSAMVLDSESKERALVGEVISTVALAGQICREKRVSDHGIDLEIELRNDAGEPTGEMLFVQLKSGDSYLRKRKSDGAEIFTIRDERHVSYWIEQKFPVFLVIRNSDGEVRWMEIRDYLRRESNNGKKRVRQIVFQGERLDVMSVRRWRESRFRGTRDLLFQRGSGALDERTRCEALRGLVAWPDDTTRTFLLEIAHKDQSPEVRAVCYEALSERWWNELEVRHWLRARISVESGQTQERLIQAIRSASSQLARFWEAKLSGQQSREEEPEVLPGYPAFRISRFRLRDIGPFHDTQEVVLQKDVNVFLGDNAAGKTTILRCLALAAIGLAAANEIETKAGGYLRKGSRRGSIEVLFELIPDLGGLSTGAGYFAVGLQIMAGSTRFVQIPDEDLTLHRPDKPNAPLVNCAKHLGKLRSDWSSQFGFISGYGAVRTFSEGRDSMRNEERKENDWVRSLFDADAWLVTPEGFSELLRGDTSGIEESRTGYLSSKLVGALHRSLDDLVLSNDGKLFSEGENDLQLNGTPLRFGELSDGYRSLFALMGHLLRCSLKVRDWNDDPTQIDGTILIDEIDLHLHPTWQHHVVQDFCRAFPNTQLIASTHSPLVVGALKREEIMIMRREQDGSIRVERPEFDLQGLGVAGILTSIFDLSSTIDQPTLDKITRRLLLHSKRETWTKEEGREYAELTDELAKLGFNREFSDPYFERFAIAMARRHKAAVEKLTPQEKLEIDSYADELLAGIHGGEVR